MKLTLSFAQNNSDIVGITTNKLNQDEKTLSPPKWKSMPLMSLTADIIKDLGPTAEITYYEDKLDSNQTECPDEYWNERYMERNAAINKKKLEEAHTDWCPVMPGRL